MGRCRKLGQQSLAPGQNQWFSHKYRFADEKRSPELLVRCDSDLTQQRYDQTYSLDRRAAAGKSCSKGKPYAFEYEPRNRKFIDLKAL